MSSTDVDELAGVILALDVGSSSVRCSAYSNDRGAQSAGRATSSSACCLLLLASSRRTRRSVDFQGRIAWTTEEEEEGEQSNLLDVLDACVDDVLAQLREKKNMTTKIQAVGFSTFAMNLIGVNQLGDVLGEDATMSYACQIPEVNVEVEKLKR